MPLNLDILGVCLTKDLATTNDTSQLQDASSMKSPSVQSNPYLSLPGVVQDGRRCVCWVLIGMKMMVEITHGTVAVDSHSTEKGVFPSERNICESKHSTAPE